MNINFPHLFIKETESTNLVALDLLAKTNPSNGFMVITDYQTAGKGQYGRNWQGERGKNLLFSLLLRPMNLSVNQLFKLHVASSIAMIRSLNEFNLPQLTIKWPNDIYAGNKKLAGILIQNQIKGSLIESSIIGIGINVNQTHFPVELNATSIQLETGIETVREELVKDIRNRIMDIMSIYDQEKWELLWHEYNSNLYLKDQLIKFTTKDENSFDGKINSVTKEGKLCIQNLENKITEHTFGEIKYGRKL